MSAVVLGYYRRSELFKPYLGSHFNILFNPILGLFLLTLWHWKWMGVHCVQKLREN